MKIIEIAKLLGYKEDQIHHIGYSNGNISPPYFPMKMNGCVLVINYTNNTNKPTRIGYHYLTDDYINKLTSLYREQVFDNLNGKKIDNDFKLNLLVSQVCLHDFKVSYIDEMRDDRITETTDGYGGDSSYDQREFTFPLELFLLQSSRTYKFYYDEISNLENYKELSFNINFPDIHGWMCEKWRDECLDLLGEKNEYTSSYNKNLNIHEFGQKILDKLKIMKKYEDFYVDGVKIFSERKGPVSIDVKLEEIEVKSKTIKI